MASSDVEEQDSGERKVSDSEKVNKFSEGDADDRGRRDDDEPRGGRGRKFEDEPQPGPDCRVYCGGLGQSSISDEEIKKVFSTAGEVQHVVNKGTYAFVDFSSSEHAQAAVDQLNNTTQFGNLEIRVELSRPRGGGGGASGGCFQCGGEGHFARECPDRRGGGRSGGGFDRRSRDCYNCNKPGHIARECTDPPSRDGRGGGRGRSPYNSRRSDDEPRRRGYEDYGRRQRSRSPAGSRGGYGGGSDRYDDYGGGRSYGRGDSGYSSRYSGGDYGGSSSYQRDDCGRGGSSASYGGAARPSYDGAARGGYEDDSRYQRR